MNYLAVLGRQPEISLAELSALFQTVQKIAPGLATFASDTPPDINRLGGSLKLAKKLDQPLITYLQTLPAGKITLGLSDYSKNPKNQTKEAMKIKKILARAGRNVRIVQSQTPVLSTATAHHNKLGAKPTAVEILIVGKDKYISLGTQNITAYAKRDQARPARDAKVGMLPPKLAQILINLCGPLPEKATVLDPFCGTGVVLQEAYLMGYTPYGTDKDPRMVNFSTKNLAWLVAAQNHPVPPSRQPNREHPTPTPSGPASNRPAPLCEVADATTAVWSQPIDAVACETYLGVPMSTPPPEVKLKQEKQICQEIIKSFLQNLQAQIKKDTPVVLALPAWLRTTGAYETLNLDFLDNMEYNRYKELGEKALLYHREGQIVARNIIVLRKK